MIFEETLMYAIFEWAGRAFKMNLYSYLLVFTPLVLMMIIAIPFALVIDCIHALASLNK